MPEKGLRQQILEAPNITILIRLLEQGSRYEWASVQTRNGWARAADRRRRELSRAPKAEQPAEVKS